MKLCQTTLLVVSCALSLAAQNKPRARDLGVPFEGEPGALNSIVDVAGVEVGHKTLIYGDGKLQVGAGPVLAAATPIWTPGKQSSAPEFMALVAMNRNRVWTRTPWLACHGLI